MLVATARISSAAVAVACAALVTDDRISGERKRNKYNEISEKLNSNDNKKKP